MKKICFVVQRYGLEVNGGAELQCRQFAEHLIGRYEVHVATTCAIDYVTWKNEYDSETEEINGVLVHRFANSQERKQENFDRINGKFLTKGLDEEEEKEWLIEQGPYCPKLIEYISECKSDYDAFIFHTYLYYPTVLGIPEVFDKAILVPEAHDEPFLELKCVQKMFDLPRAFFFNTEEERALVWDRFDVSTVINEIGGAGIDIPEVVDASRFKKKYNVDNYMIYVGRIDEGKNCQCLFQYFDELKKRSQCDLKLVLLGKSAMSIPIREDILSLGFVEDEDKYDGIAGAEMLVLPSKNESLSLVVLEAMALKTPVIVNGSCPVLKGHCIKSNGAFYYENYFEFEAEVDYILTHEKEKMIMCDNATKYVKDNYQWSSIVDKLSRLIEQL